MLSDTIRMQSSKSRIKKFYRTTDTVSSKNGKEKKGGGKRTDYRF